MPSLTLLDMMKDMEPTGVFLRQSKVYLHENFNRHNCDDIELKVQFKSWPSENYNVFINEETKEGGVLFQFNAGVRLIDTSTDESSDKFMRLEITANFEVEYYLRQNIENFNEEMISEFINNSVHHHFWPYWREYLQSTCARLGVPEIIVPFRMPLKQSKKERK